MVEPIDLPNDRVVAYRFSGQLTADEIKSVADLLDKKTDHPEILRFYAEYTQTDGITPKAIWEDLKFDLSHLTDFDKVAFVMDSDVLGLSAQLANLIPGLNVKYFKPDEKEQARQWVMN